MPINPNDITAYRRKKKRRNFIIKLVVFAVIVIVAAIVWFWRDVVFEPLRGIASRIEPASVTDAEAGFPVPLRSSASYSLNKFGQNFLLLTDTYLYTYDMAGRQNYAIQHGYSDPIEVANDRRILLYNYNAYDFSLYNRTSKLYSVTLEDKIVSAFLGGDYAAVVTKSARYSNTIGVYDGSGKWKYTRKFVDENVTGVAFSDDGNSIIVITINVNNGENISTVYRFDLNNSGDAIWSYRLPKGSFAVKVNISGDYINILCDDLFASVSYENGDLYGSYSFSDDITYAVLLGNTSVIALYDSVSSNYMLTSLDKTGEALGTKIVSNNIKEVEISGEMVYTLEGTSISIYDRTLEKTGEIELEEEYNDFLIISNEIVLMGYDEVKKINIS